MATKWHFWFGSPNIVVFALRICFSHFTGGKLGNDTIRQGCGHWVRAKRWAVFTDSAPPTLAVLSYNKFGMASTGGEIVSREPENATGSV